MDLERIAQLIPIRKAVELPLDIHSVDVYELTNRVQNLMNKPARQDTWNRSWPWADTWVDQQTSVHSNLITWLCLGSLKSYGLYMLYLANCDYGASRSFVKHLLTRGEPMPDITYLLINLVCMAYSVDTQTIQHSIEPEHKQAFGVLIRRMLATEEEWTRVMSDPRVDILAMGGWRNTIIGTGAAILSKVDVWPDSGQYVDLGGGHQTPWVSRFFGKPFVSHDIKSPWPYEPAILRRIDSDTTDWVTMEGEGLANYRAALQRQAWVPYNVFDQVLPWAERTTVISTGFIASNLMDIHNDTRGVLRFEHPRDRNKLTGYMGILGVLQLLYQGGDVQLITVSKPSSYPPAWRLVHLQWVNGQLVKKQLIGWDGSGGIRGFTMHVKEKRRAQMDPGNPTISAEFGLI